MYICSVNHSTEAQVVFWKGEKAGHAVLDAGRQKFRTVWQMEAWWVSPDQSASVPYTTEH